MRIAWVTYDFEEYSILHVNAMAEQHSVLLCSPQTSAEPSVHHLSSKVEQFAFHKPRLRQPIRQLLSVQTLLRRIHAFEPDVVHFQQGHMWFNFFLRKLKKYPLVITIHDPRHHVGDLSSQKTPQWLMDYGFRKADQVIVHGQALANQVETLFGFPASRVHVIPHVAMGKSDDAQPHAEDPNLVLFFGRIWQYKGLDLLIAAQPLITAALPNARIMIAGEGDNFDKYRRLMKQPDRFIIRNEWISDEERAVLFRKAAVVVLPYHEATQSGVVPVAYQCSKPVVATNVGALAEVVDDEVTGLLIPPRQPEALAKALIRLLSNREERLAMGRAGKAKLDSSASPCVVASQTLDVYVQAISSKRAASPILTGAIDEVTEQSPAFSNVRGD